MSLLSPRENPYLYGHEEIEAELAEVIASGNVPHGWLITGAKGVGKATLAYRFAKKLLDVAPVEEAGGGLFGDELPVTAAKDLSIDPESDVFNRVAIGSHSDVMTLEPTNIGEDGKEKAGFELRIYQVRKLTEFLGQTAAEAGWRVVIIDSVDDMNNNAANALLKLLEEPPKQTIFMLISHQPGRLLPTIRSRCRVLNLRPLKDDAVDRVMQELQQDSTISPESRRLAIRMASGAPGYAMTLAEEECAALYDKLLEILERAPDIEVRSLQAISEQLAKKDQAHRWHLFLEMLRWFIQQTVISATTGLQDGKELEQEVRVREKLLAHYSVDELYGLWEKASQIEAQTDGLNMDKAYATSHLFGYLQTLDA